MAAKMIEDDRERFLEERKRNSIALGQDSDAFFASTAAIVQADKHKYAYLWTWLGVPIIQMPVDVMATQEVVWKTKPDVIIETGVARGGSVVFLASLLEIIGKGKVIGVDVDIRPHNLRSIVDHPLAHRIDLIEGPSTSQETLARVCAAIPEGASVMAILDSDHSHAHVLDELRCYAPMISVDHYLVVADTLLGHLSAETTPTARSHVWKPGNEPLSALRAFMRENTSFAVDEETNGKLVFSSSPGGYLRRTS